MLSSDYTYPFTHVLTHVHTWFCTFPCLSVYMNKGINNVFFWPHCENKTVFCWGFSWGGGLCIQEDYLLWPTSSLLEFKPILETTSIAISASNVHIRICPVLVQARHACFVSSPNPYRTPQIPSDLLSKSPSSQPHLERSPNSMCHFLHTICHYSQTLKGIVQWKRSREPRNKLTPPSLSLVTTLQSFVIRDFYVGIMYCKPPLHECVSSVCLHATWSALISATAKTQPALLRRRCWRSKS